ncbi:nucleotidyltransferase domain-containing protein [Spirosoma pollinicola]|uniref:Nucleotidyltransferase family protein n=1 Tax=Spirosoma pollinicola TaxID=2057025 RepID=A0A2K8YXX0_9BACT|nr:nucleotidyltransferase family protein [Spirosoma pollinicola]AUD02480.1 hypothetical protein CWM47_11975 [Spirosoma pollinicola]
MNTGLSPEITVLLMGCLVDLSTDKQTQINQYIQQQLIDWKRLDTLADRHRLKPFLYRTLLKIPNAPTAFVESLKQDCRITATDNLLKLQHYKEVSALLTEHAIEHIPLKGVYLAEHAYPDSSLRISGDIDLLVGKDDVFRTIRLLQNHAYHLSKKQDLHWQQGEQTILSDLYEVSLFKPFFNDSHFDIDLHWKIMGFNQHYALFDLPYVRSQPEFSTELMIVLLVTHHGVNNVWQQIYYINDLYFSLKGKDINWNWLLQELGRYGFEDVFLAGLYWCVQIWNLSLPATVQTLIGSSKIHSIAEDYAQSWESDKANEFSDLILLQLTRLAKAQTKPGRRLKTYGTFLSSRVFRYSLFRVGPRLIYLPKEVGFLTIFIRATQSLFRFLPARSTN